MKGTVVSTWIKTCRKLHGDTLVDQSLVTCGLESKVVFSPLEDVEDSLVFKLFEEIASEANVDITKLWKAIGTDNILTFKEDYPGFFLGEKMPTSFSIQ